MIKFYTSILPCIVVMGPNNEVLEEVELPAIQPEVRVNDENVGEEAAGQIPQLPLLAAGGINGWRPRQYDKYIDILLRLPLLFLMDQILLQDMGIHYFNKGNNSSQV